MPFIAKCPYCPTKIKLPDHALGASISCPRCHNHFTAVPPEEAAPAAEPKIGLARAISGSSVSTSEAAPVQSAPSPEAPARAFAINPWGLAGFSLAAAALLLVSLGHWRFLAIVLAIVGVLAVVLGVVANLDQRPSARRGLWLGLGGAVSGIALVLVMFFPQLLNAYWGIDFGVPQANPNQQVLVPRHPGKEEKPLADGEWADAVAEAVRQDDVLVRLESVQSAEEVGAKPPKKNLLVHLQLVHLGHERKIKFAGFSSDGSQPVLTDASGDSYSFREERLRKPAKGAAVFEAGYRPKTLYLLPTGHLDVLLMFEAPLSFEALYLEVPASAWGRSGTCRFRIARFFATRPPEVKKK
jgi:hypothetical protein